MHSEIRIVRLSRRESLTTISAVMTTAIKYLVSGQAIFQWQLVELEELLVRAPYREEVVSIYPVVRGRARESEGRVKEE